jgi:type III secretion system YopN/LcrE/InvE/MxiC family regulator
LALGTVPREMTVQTVATQNMVSPRGSEEVAAHHGTHRGNPAQNATQNSKISQAPRDVGTSAALNINVKSLHQRSLRQGQATNLVATARIADFYDKLPNMPELNHMEGLIDTFSQFEALQRRGEDLSGDASEESEAEDASTADGEVAADDLLAALQKFDGDVTHQFAALEIAREFFESRGASRDFMNLLDEAKGEYEKTSIARDVRAGFAIAEIAKRAAATLETDPATVRDTYRAMLREQPNIGKVFDALSKFDLSKNLGQVIDIFVAAASRDLSSTSSSTDERFLHGLMTELGKLKKIRSVFESGKDLINQTERLLGPSERGKTDPTQLTARVLNFCAKTAVNLADARVLLGSLDKASPQSQVVFTNGLRVLHSEIPDDVLPSPQARLQQVATLSTLLNQLVAAEEASFESGARAPKT